MFEVKRNEKQINKTFRFPESLLDRLTKVAKDNKISVNTLLKQMAEYTLTELEKIEGKKK